jgi:hypothetical protein
MMFEKCRFVASVGKCCGEQKLRLHHHGNTRSKNHEQNLDVEPIRIVCMSEREFY